MVYLNAGFACRVTLETPQMSNDETMLLCLIGTDWKDGNWLVVAHSLYCARTVLNFVAPQVPVLADLDFLAWLVQDQLRWQ